MRSLTPGLAILALTACRSGSAPVAEDTTPVTVHTTMAGDEDAPPPSYPRADLLKAIAAERVAIAHAEEQLATLEAGGGEVLVARADLAVRRRFLATLEVCEASGRLCPPRLDDPPWRHAVDADTDPQLDVPLRFDVDSWRKVAGELTGRACACRTLACVDSLDATIARLELRPMPDVQQDDEATTSVTRARECLLRLRGKKQLPRVAAE